MLAIHNESNIIVMAAVHLGLLGPAAYVPASDPILAQRADEIANAAKENGRLEAAYLGAAAVARAFFINVPYHLTVGTYNAVNLFSDDPVLEHFRDALINLAFAAISVIYIAAGIIYSAAFEGFRMAIQQPPVEEEGPEDLHVDEEEEVHHDDIPEVLQDLAGLEARARELAGQVGGEDQLALQLVHQGPVKREELLQMYVNFIQGFQEAIRINGVINFQQIFEIAGERFVINFDFTKPDEHRRCVEICQQGLALIERLSLGQPPLGRQLLHLPERPHEPAPLFNFWGLPGFNPRFPYAADRVFQNLFLPQPRCALLPPPPQVEDEFVHVDGPILPDVGVYEAELYGQNGVQFRRMGYRVALDEYQRLLQDEFGIDINERLQATEAWPQENESVRLLRNTLIMLSNPKAEGYYNEAIRQYKAFVAEHRKLIASYAAETGLSAEIDTEIKRISQAIATVRFMANIQGFSEDLVHKHIPEHAPLTPQNFHELFVQRNNGVKRAPAGMKMSAYDTAWRQVYGAMSWLDFFSEPDVPNLRGISQWEGPQGKREILHLRHATPHIAGAKIAPEYGEFVRAKAAKDEGVLYTAYQRLNDVGRLENEHARCQSLIEFERENPNFYLLFHSVENAVFKRTGGTFAVLKAGLIDSFYQPDVTNANRLPRHLQKDLEYREVMETLFDQVHDIFFDNREEIDLTPIDHFGGLKEGEKICEWQVCIMLFYYFQREDMKFRTDLPITTEVNPCKDNFDRGGGQNITSDRARQHKLHGANVPSQLLEATMSSVQAPPIMGKGIPAIPKRINPSLAVSHLLANLPPEKLRQFQALRFNGWQLSSYGMEKRAHQKATFLPQDAQTPEELVHCIRSVTVPHTIANNDMVEENGKRYPTREAVIHQLNTILQGRAHIEIDGVHYHGYQGWMGRYDAQGILDLLMENHNLSEERALRIMRQLEVQIFSDPMAGLKAAFDRVDLNLMVQQVPELPQEVKISLTTVGDQFVVTGVKKLQLQDFNRDGATLHVFDTTVTLRIPKDEAQEETGEWSWSHA